MRVAALGASFADDLVKLTEQAELSVVTLIAIRRESRAQSRLPWLLRWHGDTKTHRLLRVIFCRGFVSERPRARSVVALSRPLLFPPTLLSNGRSPC
jgi:hypothetical protein